ncbi:MAG TPA: hypothetical protein VF190_07110 [Rhodothermales bacterium]
MQYPLVFRVGLPRFLLLGALLVAGCGGSESDETVSAALIRLDLDRSEPERLIRYYFGGYVSRSAADPFDAGLVEDHDDRLYLNLDSLHRRFPSSVGSLRDADLDNRLEWEEIEAFLERTYYDARDLPGTIDSLRSRFGIPDDPADVLVVEVDGVMTTARRRISIARDAIREALRGYRANGDRLIYPTSTVIVGEHLQDGRVAETTAMIKRGDGFWDFAAYGPDGALAPSTQTPPKPLAAPTQCVGCHFGSKQFEPETSFPGEARPGPHGPRAVYVDDAVRDPEIVAFFNEHARRSDTVLGLYATLFTAQLRAEQNAGTISPADAEILSALGL